MARLKKRLITIFSSFAILFALIVAASAPASAATGGRVGYAGGDRTSMSICHNLSSPTTCGSGVGSLSPGQWSHTKYGWADTDAFYVPRGCSAYISPNYIYATGGSTGRWAKFSSDWSGSVTLKCR
jgi:hypothetical protein